MTPVSDQFIITYCSTLTQVDGEDWDVFLLSDEGGRRAFRFPSRESDPQAVPDSCWFEPAAALLDPTGVWVRKLIAPLLVHLSATGRVQWRMLWTRFAKDNATCLVQVRVARPNGLPEALHMVAGDTEPAEAERAASTAPLAAQQRRGMAF